MPTDLPASRWTRSARFRLTARGELVVALAVIALVVFLAGLGAAVCGPS